MDIVIFNRKQTCVDYSTFHRFGQAKICIGGLVLASSQFLLLPQLPQKDTCYKSDENWRNFLARKSSGRRSQLGCKK